MRPDTYFEDVVVANAMIFDNRLKYLQYSSAVDSSGGFDFHTTKGTTKDITWSVSLDVWVGAGGGEEVSLFGFGEGMQDEFLAGFSFSASGTEEAGEEHSWGLGLDFSTYVVPPPPSVETSDPTAPGVASYNWRLYFLPPSARWRDEFLAYRKQAPVVSGLQNDGLLAKIDPSCQPWRIVYEVSDYEMVGGVAPYPSSGSPPTPLPPSILTWWLDRPLAANIWKENSMVAYGVSFFSGPFESPITWNTPAQVTGYVPRAHDSH